MLSHWVDRTLHDVEVGVARALGYVPTETVDALVDVAALVAAADGTQDRPIERCETLEILTLLRQLGRLRRGQLRHATERFQSTASALRHGGVTHRRAILDRTRQLAERPDQAKLLMRMAHEVALADGLEGDAEWAVLCELGEAMGIDPACCRPAA